MIIRVANAPCSWGVLEFDDMAEPLGCDQVLDEIAASGFAGTELGDWGFMPTHPTALRDAVVGRGLDLVGAFVPVALSRPEMAEAGRSTAVKTAQLLADAGADAFIVLSDDNGTDPVRTRQAGRIRPSLGLRSEQWDAAAAVANEVARSVFAETGLRTVFHHHAAGFVETPEETEALLERTDPELLGLCLDTGHWTFGGGDPVAALDRWGDRIWHVHFKDCDAVVAASVCEAEAGYFAAVQQGVFCELGQGVVDFPSVVSALQRRSYEGWIVVEQDVLPSMGTPLMSAVRNRGYLARMGL
jgi:inosose dehydratase